jgi:hypothetical protein
MSKHKIKYTLTLLIPTLKNYKRFQFQPKVKTMNRESSQDKIKVKINREKEEDKEREREWTMVGLLVSGNQCSQLSKAQLHIVHPTPQLLFFFSVHKKWVVYNCARVDSV